MCRPYIKTMTDPIVYGVRVRGRRRRGACEPGDRRRSSRSAGGRPLPSIDRAGLPAQISSAELAPICSAPGAVGTPSVRRQRSPIARGTAGTAAELSVATTTTTTTTTAMAIAAVRALGSRLSSSGTEPANSTTLCYVCCCLPAVCGGRLSLSDRSTTAMMLRHTQQLVMADDDNSSLTATSTIPVQPPSRRSRSLLHSVGSAGPGVFNRNGSGGSVGSGSRNCAGWISRRGAAISRRYTLPSGPADSGCPTLGVQCHGFVKMKTLRTTKSNPPAAAADEEPIKCVDSSSNRHSVVVVPTQNQAEQFL